jgi:hypothetical protein
MHQVRQSFVGALIRYGIIITLIMTVFMLPSTQVVQAVSAPAAVPSAMPMVTINGGGGTNGAGSDGIQMTFNRPNSGENIKFTNRNFMYCSGDVAQVLNIGGTSYTTFNGSCASSGISSKAKFDSLVIGNLTGSANTSGATTTGSGSAIMTYTKTISGLTYVLEPDYLYLS